MINKDKIDAIGDILLDIVLKAQEMKRALDDVRENDLIMSRREIEQLIEKENSEDAKRALRKVIFNEQA
jgi:hypothetical protein